MHLLEMATKGAFQFWQYTNRMVVHFGLLCLLSGVAVAQRGSIHVESRHFNIDTSMRLILVNADVHALNSVATGPKSRISSNGAEFSLVSPVPAFKTGLAYEVTDVENSLYHLHFTQLPVVHISSSNPILDEPRVHAHFSLCESDGNITESSIGIEYRGGWSQTLPKKSLRIEFWKDGLGEDTENFSLLGMRSDDDWNLQAMYNEPLRLRSMLNFELWRKIDTLYYLQDEPQAINGVHQQYVEVFINNGYSGLYALSERIDRKQLQLAKSRNGEPGGELYKGITWGASTFTDLPQYSNNNDVWSGFKYKYPEDDIDWANLYNLVDFVINEDSATFYAHHQDRFNVDNAVNYFIFLNLLRATDNTGKNVYIAKQDGDAPYFYVPWDLDGTFGIIWNGTQANITDDLISNGFYDRLMLSNVFLEKLKNRWNLLRCNVISVDRLMGEFNRNYQYLNANGVYEREVKAWPECAFIDFNNIEYTQKWLENRIAYLDTAFNGLEDLPAKNSRFIIFPNPASHWLDYEVSINDRCTLEKISIFNYLGQPLSINLSHESKQKIELSNLDDGVYLVVAHFSDGYRQVEKLVVRK
jgi:hypothetical protein